MPGTFVVIGVRSNLEVDLLEAFGDRYI